MPAGIFDNVALVAQLEKLGVGAHALRLVPQNGLYPVFMANVRNGHERIPEPLRVGLPVAGIHPAAAEQLVPARVHLPVLELEARVQPKLDALDLVFIRRRLHHAGGRRGVHLRHGGQRLPVRLREHKVIHKVAPYILATHHVLFPEQQRHQRRAQLFARLQVGIEHLLARGHIHAVAGFHNVGEPLARPADREEHALLTPGRVLVVPLQAVIGRPAHARLAFGARHAYRFPVFQGAKLRQKRDGCLPAALEGKQLVVAVVALPKRVGQPVKLRDDSRVRVRRVLQPHRPLNHRGDLVKSRVHRHRQRLPGPGIGEGVVRARIVVRRRLQALLIRCEHLGEIRAVHREVKGQASAFRALQNILRQIFFRALKFVLGGRDLVRVERVRPVQIEVFVAGEAGLQLQRAAPRTAGNQRNSQAEQQYERKCFFHCFSHVNLLSFRGPRPRGPDVFTVYAGKECARTSPAGRRLPLFVAKCRAGEMFFYYSMRRPRFQGFYPTKNQLISSAVCRPRHSSAQAEQAAHGNKRQKNAGSVQLPALECENNAAISRNRSRGSRAPRVP